MKLFYTLALLTLLAACKPVTEPDMKLSVAHGGRIQIERIGVLEDPLAYGDKRGVYIIRDTKTGAEYIGVSGIGISQTADHMNGKVKKQHEE